MSPNSRRKKYVNKAIGVFKQQGLRLSLEEVALYMGITKKTIYNNFSSRDDLLKECILSISNDFRQALSMLDKPEDNAVINYRNSFKNISQLFTALSPIFFFDIMKLNPNLAWSEHLLGRGYFHEKTRANLEQGIKQGVYRADLDVELLSDYMGYSIFGFYINGLVNNRSFNSKMYFENIAEYNLRSIVTDKGKQFLKDQL